MSTSTSASASSSAAAASSSSSDEPANAVPAAAIGWISTQLSSSSGGGRAAADRAAYLPTRGLDALQVKDLKALCTALQSLVDDALAGGSGSDSRGTGAASLTARQLEAYTRFAKPKSGAKKALWMAALRRCFYTNDDCTAVAPSSDPIWALLRSSAATSRSTSGSGGGGGAASSRSAARPAAAPAASAPAPAASSAAAPHGMPDLHCQLQQQIMGFGGFSPSYCGGGSGGGGGAAALAAASSLAGSPFAASAAAAATTTSKAQKRKPPSRKRPAPPPSLPPPAAPDCVDFFVPESQWPPPNTNGGLALLVKIKQEEHAAASASASAHGSSRPSSLMSNTDDNDDDDDDDDDDDRPRDMREMSLLGQLRTMGFTDKREMLVGLRHVMKDGAGSFLDSGTILEEAMMWIISQREETEEAKKMDAVRIMAENEQVEEERRRKEAERRLEDAPIEDIVGAAAGAAAAEGGGEQDKGAAAAAAGAAQAATPSKHKAGRSKYFHFSILLHSPLVRSVFLSISCPEAKKELVRLLRLEQKANQWYGSVLPWAYFTYVATSRIEKWAHDESGGSSGSDAGPKKGEKGGEEKAQDITSLIRNEANILERALFALSEQHDNGLQNVPKIFIEARDDCAKKGLPDGPEGHATGDKSIDNEDDDVVLVMGTFSCATKKSVNDNDLDRKPAALPVAFPSGSSHSPHRTCASSEGKRPAKSSSEVIEIM